MDNNRQRDDKGEDPGQGLNLHSFEHFEGEYLAGVC